MQSRGKLKEELWGDGFASEQTVSIDKNKKVMRWSWGRRDARRMLEWSWGWGESTAVNAEGKGWILQGRGKGFVSWNLGGKLTPIKPNLSQKKEGKSLFCKSRAGQGGVESKAQKVQRRNDKKLLPCEKRLNRLGHFSLKKRCLRRDMKEDFMLFLPRERHIVVRLWIFLSL